MIESRPVEGPERLTTPASVGSWGARSEATTAPSLWPATIQTRTFAALSPRPSRSAFRAARATSTAEKAEQGHQRHQGPKSPVSASCMSLTSLWSLESLGSLVHDFYPPGPTLKPHAT